MSVKTLDMSKMSFSKLLESVRELSVAEGTQFETGPTEPSEDNDEEDDDDDGVGEPVVYATGHLPWDASINSVSPVRIKLAIVDSSKNCHLVSNGMDELDNE